MDSEELLNSTLLLTIMDIIAVTTHGTTREPEPTTTVLATTLEPGERQMLTLMEELG
jgi:hypothetical protein